MPNKVPPDAKRALDANTETENGPLRFRGKVAFWWYATVALMLTETIPYSAINLAKESHSVLASLSTSLDRMLIQYGSQNNVVLIAVKDKESFLSELHKRNPHIYIERKA